MSSRRRQPTQTSRDIFSGSSCCSVSSVGWLPPPTSRYVTDYTGCGPLYLGPLRAEDFFQDRLKPRRSHSDKKEYRKQLKAECKAQLMLADMIGHQEWQAYRKSNLLLVIAEHDWLIGDFFKQYDKFHPFVWKPDVLRVDGRKVLGEGYAATKFCVDPVDSTRQGMPYSDKVFAYAMHCYFDEGNFYKTGNRLGEISLNSIPRCAVFDPDKRRKKGPAN